VKHERGVTTARVASRWEEGRDVVPGVSRAKALFLLAAGLSFLMSVYLFFTGDHMRGIFVGLWVPSILAGGALLVGRESDE